MTREEKEASFERAKATPYVRRAYGDVSWHPPRYVTEAMKVRDGGGPDYRVYCRPISVEMQFHARIRKVCAYCEGQHPLSNCAAMRRELKFGEDWFLYHKGLGVK